MACLLQLERNFLHGFCRCKLPVEVVDVEVKITSMQGMHIFRRDRMTQLIKCTPWSTRLHPHTTMIKKLKTFLEVEGKMGLIPVPVPGNSSLHSQKLIQMSGKMMLLKREREQHPKRSSGQPPPILLQHALPYPKLHQSLRIAHHQYH